MRKGDVSVTQASKFSKALTLHYTMQRKKALKRKRIAFSCIFKYGIDTYKRNLLQFPSQPFLGSSRNDPKNGHEGE